MSERAEYWSHHLAAIATEGIATQAYAKREGLAAASLYYWRKRLNAANSKDPVLPGGRFLAVQLPQHNEDSGCQLCIGTGVQLHLSGWPRGAPTACRCWPNCATGWTKRCRRCRRRRSSAKRCVTWQASGNV